MNRESVVIALLIIAPILIGIIKTSGSSSSGGSSVGFSGFSKSVGVVNLKGVIYSSSKIVKDINTFKKSKNIVAIIVRIDSPGGAVAPSQEIYHALMNFRASGKEIVISMGTVAASGGYYAASAGDIIFANGGTLTGSVGVIMQFPHYYKLLEKIGIEMTTITAGNLKDAGTPHRKITESDRRYFNNLIKNTHEQFINHIALGRNKTIEEIKPLAEGEIFTGEQAVENGLIDTIGTYEDAKEYLLQNNNLAADTKFVEITEDKSVFGSLIESRIGSFIQRITARGGVFVLATPLI